ncbi:hypothetical protein N5J06_03935 [Ralstonia sp. CHL-2022]|uniref:Uncharacterized protein n=1 Tax=Ralstonia mojiangensis TaxID=2953895 RepID=A0ABT2L3T8_9RALS|nr:hypothetical protein [Ralstonia mojiangensis]MCT7310080.1 hypothetical protein [Ralstonia mojiangensis]
MTARDSWEHNPILRLLRSLLLIWIVIGILALPYFFFLKVKGATEKLPSSCCDDERKFWTLYRSTHAVLMYGSLTLILWFVQVFVFDLSDRKLTFYLAAVVNVFGSLHAVFMDRSIWQQYDYLSLVQINWMYVLGIAAIGYCRYRMYGGCGYQFAWRPSQRELDRRERLHQLYEVPYDAMTRKMFDCMYAKPSDEPNFKDLPPAEQGRRMDAWQAELDAIKAQLATMPRASHFQ